MPELHKTGMPVSAYERRLENTHEKMITEGV
jgi:hypothetical protein